MQAYGNKPQIDLWKDEADTYVVGQSLLMSFRSLTEPLMQRTLYSEWLSAVSADKHHLKIQNLRRLLHRRCMPEMEEKVLRHLLLVLHRMSNKAHMRKSKTTPEKLAALWGPILLR